MSSLHCVVHPLPGTEDQLNERLKELGHKINWVGSQGVQALADVHMKIIEVVIGPSHIGILTEDGRVARLVFSINTEGLDLNKTEQSKGLPTRSSSKAPSQSTAKLARLSTGARRIVRTTSSAGVRGGRAASGVIMGAPFLTTSYVPEELVSQAQVVLQGKSRNLIIRELQRTNLDVNQAVNNLLSRDDDEVDEPEESDSYAPDDLISLLDANISVASDHPSVIIDAESMFSEDMFGYSGIRSRANACRSRGGERDSSSGVSVVDSRQEKGELRWRDLHLGGDSNKKKDNPSLPNAVDIADMIQWWPEKILLDGSTKLRFKSIVAMHSELIAVSLEGQLHQWRWADREPYNNSEMPNIFHPKTIPLGLLKENISAISAANIRCSVATKSGKVATWMDESLSEVSSRLEQAAQTYSEFQADRIVSLNTCQLYTCAFCESGALYWWGVLPFNQRKKLWEKFKGKTRKQKSDIVEGDKVGMRSSPMYHAGAIAFYMSAGSPKIGQLMNAAWNLSQSCRFKILPPSSVGSMSSNLSNLASSNIVLPSASTVDKKTVDSNSAKLKSSESKDTADKMDMPPPPSPASSTCSDTGSSSSSTYKRGKRHAPKDHADRYDEEEWPLKDVIFVEDTRPQPIWEVLAVDGEQVVLVPNPTEANITVISEGKGNLRVIHRNQLQVIKASGTPRVPDCYQRSPKRVPISDGGQILTVAVDARGIHAVLRMGTKITYGIYNLTSGKFLQEASLPTESSAFIGKDQSSISIVTAGESENVVILRDGNSTVYPLSKDCANTIKDPIWPDLPPISCLGIATHFLHSAAANQKNLVAFIVFAVKKQILIPKILKCDLEGVKHILRSLDANNGQYDIEKLLEEKCDGNHNILHSCVSACCPVASKEKDPDPPYDKDSILSSSLWLSDSTDPIGSLVSGIQDNILMESSSSKSMAGPSMPTLTASDPTERKQCILYILKGITESVAFRSNLRSLLMARDSNGLTPFMLAVSGRAYEAAHILLDVITRLARDNSMDSDSEKRAMNQMIFPVGSNADDSPLHVICYNDTCSFTWTGDQHINQDIFECRTCGLTGSLCCCTECARVCHKGHDCKLKHTSPTAYCDCWQKCKCKSLKAGQQTARFDLLSRLITDTDLVVYPNARGENIILFLLQTVRRQVREQKQFAKFRSCPTSRKSGNSDPDLDLPDHDLEPPKFSRKALERLLKDWNAIKAMIMTGHKQLPDINTVPENFNFMKYQGHTTNLDKFTYCLLVKLFVPAQEDKTFRSKSYNCEDDERKSIADSMVTTLISSLQRELHNDSTHGRKEEAVKVARRFMASAVRIFVVLAIEMLPQTNKKKTAQYPQPLAKCLKLFESLLPMAICELCDAADALLLPVRLNYVKPTASFPLTNYLVDGSLCSHEMFDVEPLQRYVVNRQSGDPDQAADSAAASGLEDHQPSGFSAVANRQPAHRRDAPQQSDDHEMEASSEREEARDRSDIGGESDMELDLLASDSDSEDNQSGAENISTQRSAAQVSAAAGSDPEDDSGDTSAGEEDEDPSDAAETDEVDAHHQLFNDIQLERRINVSMSDRGNNAAPQHLQWAIRSRSHGSARAATVGSGSSATGIPSGIYIEPPSLRRGAPGCSSATAAANSAPEPVSVASTNNTLARAFAVVIRQMSALLKLACERVKDSPGAATTNRLQLQHVTASTVISVMRHVDLKLQPTWDWLLSLMDSTEGQLRFGRELNQLVEDSGRSNSIFSGTNPVTSNAQNLVANSTLAHVNSATTGNTSSPPVAIRSRELAGIARSNPSGASQSTAASVPTTASGRNSLNFHIRDPILSRCQSARRASRTTNTASENQIARRDTFNYVISLLRAHKNEHCDSLPHLDVGSLKHIAYVFDALIIFLQCCDLESTNLEGYYSKASNESFSWDTWDTDENDNKDSAEDTRPSIVPMDMETHEEESNQPHLKGRRHTFFQRSNSTLYLGSIASDPFSKNIQDSLPLADKPHLLQPNARKEDLFGTPISYTHNTIGGSDAPLSTPLTRLGILDNQQAKNFAAVPTKDSFYLQLFNNANYFDQQPTDLSTTNNLCGFKNDYYDRLPIIVSPRRSSTIDTGGDSASPCRQGVKSVIVKVRGGLQPATVAPPPPYPSTSATPSGSGIYPGEINPNVILVPLDGRRASTSSGVGHTVYDVSANVTIDSVQEQIRPTLARDGVSKELLLGRWKLTIELFARVFLDDVGAEPGSVIALLGGFSVKEAKFRREMEKLRNYAQKDLVFTKLERERGQLISETFSRLNVEYHAHVGRRTQVVPPLAAKRVKVTFKDESGEGSGVARAFYTAIAEALLSHEKLPSLESCQVGLSVVRYSLYGQYKGRDRDRRQSYRTLLRREGRKNLSVDAKPFYMNSNDTTNEQGHLAEIGKSLYPKVHTLRPTLASKISGMLLELAHSQLVMLIDNDDALRTKVDEAVELILSQGRDSNAETSAQQDAEDNVEDSDDVIAPLFYQPGKRGFYSPRQGKPTPERMNAFRNVGRLIGLCLLQNELCPLYLNRHVLKFILRRPIRFHDFAFFDPVMHESLRKLVLDTETRENGAVELRSLDLNFCVDLIMEEGGDRVELADNGCKVEVNSSNVYDYVRKYAQHRMIVSQIKALQNIRDGVYDVIPASSLEFVTAEDMRLLLNGVGDINVATLISYTSFNDESTKSAEDLHRFKRWLWSIVEKMSVQEKQDLVYFWTGSPALPASEEGFQPMPSVTIRPASDTHLPTANTCISRLYIPLYSSRAILRSKLLLAIKTKFFGFV